jgi:hypothetical protein
MEKLNDSDLLVISGGFTTVNDLYNQIEGLRTALFVQHMLTCAGVGAGVVSYFGAEYAAAAITPGLTVVPTLGEGFFSISGSFSLACGGAMMGAMVGLGTGMFAVNIYEWMFS